jgi:hypothetical protein
MSFRKGILGYLDEKFTRTLLNTYGAFGTQIRLYDDCRNHFNPPAVIRFLFSTVRLSGTSMAVDIQNQSYAWNDV